MVVGATLLLLLLPWLPPRRGGRAPIQLTLHPGPVRVAARAGETLLEAGLRAGVVLPYDCRSGGCGACVCTVHNGRVDLGPYQPAALSEAMRARGQALMCCAFSAGQYINILLDDGAKRAFSFANAPPDPAAPPSTAGGLIELHVRLIPRGRFTTHVFERMQVGDPVEFEGPLGRFTLHDSQRPILFVAGATGFAPIKSILEDAFRRGIQRPMTLYWGVRTRSDLYLLDLVDRWQREQPAFRFVPVLSAADDDKDWSGRRGLVHQAMIADHPSLAGFEVYACGSVRMVEAAVPDFLAHGLDEQFCFSDAFVPTRMAAPAAARA